MNVYTVTLPGGGNNNIVADQAFVQEHFPGQWEFVREQTPPELPQPSPDEILRGAADEFLLGLVEGLK